LTLSMAISKKKKTKQKRGGEDLVDPTNTG
jgi:hypothetical protein